MFFFPSLFVILFSTICTCQYCEYDVDKFEEITCFNITALEEITDAVNATLVRDKSLPRLVEFVRLGKCELSEFTIQPLLFLPQLKKIEIFDSTIAKLPYNLFESTDELPVHTILMKGNHFKVLEPKALRGLPNLLRIDLQDNEITTISAETFSGSTVQELLLDNNNISNIQFDNSNNLVNITLSKNEIKRVNLTSFAGPKIEKLDLSNNYIEVIEPGAFGSLKNLHTLDLLFNNITKIEDGTFYGLSLRLLQLSFNKIIDLGYNSFAEARFDELLLWRNQLTEISKRTFSGCNVGNLNLQSNKIEIIERNSFDNVSSLRNLDLKWNKITTINASTFCTPSLEELNLSLNKIVSIEEGAFNECSSLRELELSGNRLTTVTKNMFSGTPFQRLNLVANVISLIEDYAFAGCDNLISLNLTDNRIKRIDKKVLPGTAIQELRIGCDVNCTLEQGVFKKFNKLQVLELRDYHKNMGKIPPFPVSVSKLWLSDIEIISIKASDFQSNISLKPALEEIEMWDNNLSTIEPYAFSNLSSLRRVRIRRNKLGKIDKYSFSQSTIKVLHLPFNGITSIDVGAFSGLNLSELDLGGNQITKIEKLTFAGSSIHILLLDSNKMEVIEPYAFLAVKNLHALSLVFNRITKIGTNIYTSPTLKLLALPKELSKLLVKDFEQLSDLQSVCVTRYYRDVLALLTHTNLS